MKREHLFLIVVSVLLVGCTSVPEKLGVSELEWTSLGSDKQERLLASYNKIVRDREKITKNDEEGLSGTYLAVNIYGGKVMMGPSFINWQIYKPVKFNIFKGQCRDIKIASKLNDEARTKLGVCFHKNILYLDPSHYDVKKKLGSVSIYSSPLWERGFSYKGVNSSGYVKLNDVTVYIKEGVRTLNLD